MIIEEKWDIPEKCGVAVQCIRIGPNVLGYSIVEDRKIPEAIIRDRAAIDLASRIVDRLTYSVRPNPIDGGFCYTLSINDYTTLESKKKEEIIRNLTKAIAQKQERIEDLSNEINYYRAIREELLNIIEYNNRSIVTKLVDWLLYDEPFRRLV